MTHPPPVSDDKILAELETGLRIDEHNLNGALRVHADFFHRVAKRLAIVISERDGAKQDVNEVEARVDAEIRGAAYKADEKITEKEVESNKRLNKDVLAAHDHLLKLNLLVGKYSALKESFVQRSYALGHLCDLYVAGYFGSDIQGSGASKIRTDGGTRAKQLISERIRSR